MAPPLFETKRLRCRRMASEDVDALFAVYSDPVAMRWVGDGRAITRAACDEWLHVTLRNYDQRGYGMFALADLHSGEVIGFCGIVHPGDQPEPEIKYAFRRDRWGQGLASETVPLLLSYGAREHDLDRVIATVAPDNRASRRVLEKSGMQRVEERDHESGVTLVYEWRAPSAPSGACGDTP